MRLRGAVILLAVVPLVLASAAVAWMTTQRSRVLAELHLAAVEPVLLAARKAELQSFVNIARSSIAHLVRDGMPNAASQQQALETLRRLEFSLDGYFFVLDFDGRVLLYPRQPMLQHSDLLALRGQDASEGSFPFERMLAQARSGGGYVEYTWRRPSSGQMEIKLAYVEPIAGWQWVLGTGTFVDEPGRARGRIAEATAGAVGDTLWRIGAITVLVTLLVVGGALLVNVNEQRRADARLRALAGQIVRLQEAERARVARELHDGVSQWLVSVKYLFESAQARARQGPDPELARQLDGGMQRLREVLGEVRRISHDLRPALLDDLGLPQALEHLAREWSARTGVAAAVHAAGLPPLPEALATALFRVAQEALGNVERHAGATQVRVSLQQEGDKLLFEIEDDGVGFDAARVLATPRAGLGLTHMRERVESFGGRFAVSSGAGGTRLSARFPGAAWQS